MPDDVTKQTEDESAQNPDQESDAGELSLAELSEAYASVLKQNERQTEDRNAGDEVTAGPDGAHDADSLADQKQPSADEKSKKGMSIQQMDAADNAPCPVSPKSIIESLLFVGSPAGAKLTLKKIAAVMRDVSPREVKRTIDELNRDYDDRDAAFRIVEDAGHYQMRLCEDLVEVQNYFFGRNRAAKLSQGAIDVLAVIAYHQPVTKARIETIRTRPSGSLLGQLLRRNLVCIVDDDQLPKEKRYRTTERFLKLFGLESLDDLPQTSVVSDLEELTDY